MKSNQACVISVGDGVDFDVEDLVMEYEYEYEKEGKNSKSCM